MRQLKRSLTVLEPEGLAEGEDALAAPAPLPPVQPLPPAVPRLPCAARSPMDPPLRPPPWKRAARPGPGTGPGPASPPPETPPHRAPQSPARRTPTPRGRSSQSPRRAPPQSPQRLLTPRVSWSDILCHSQDNLDDDAPHTPRPPSRCPPSPPHRVPWRRRPPSDDEGAITEDQNDGRFAREFCGVTVIGKGQFSTVYRAQHRIDQCLYAVKKTTRISRGLRRAQLREVFALANVSMEEEGCPNIVRYYSSWMEDGRLHIQTELCECSLRDRMAQRRHKEPRDSAFGPAELVKVLQHVANGLKVLHSCGFVHLDIKPDNILVSRNQRENGRYKIADLGLAAAAIGSGCDDISEGDCRYLAKEVLRGNLLDLPKADVFALGLLIYELATNPKPLPCNGEEWHHLREGRLEKDLLGPLPEPLFALLQRMVHGLPAERPSCDEIARHPSVAPDDGPLALEELMRQRTIEAEKTRQLALELERNRQLADTYWQEMMNLKRQELLSGGRAPPPPEPIPAGACAASAPAAAVLVRGRTF